MSLGDFRHAEGLRRQEPLDRRVQEFAQDMRRQRLGFDGALDVLARLSPSLRGLVGRSCSAICSGVMAMRWKLTGLSIPALSRWPRIFPSMSTSINTPAGS